MKKITSRIRNYVLVLGIGLIGSWISYSLGDVQAQSPQLYLKTYEGNTIFTAYSENGVHPTLQVEVSDANGQLKTYESEEGRLTIPDTNEGTTITKAKLLGKTLFLDQTTGEYLEEWEAGRDLILISSENPTLTIQGNLFDGEIVNNQDINFDTGVRTEGHRTIAANFIKVKPNTTYTLTRPVPSLNVGLRFYAQDQTFLFSKPFLSFNGQTQATFTTPEDCYYIKFIDEANTLDNNYFIEETDTRNMVTLTEDLTLRGIGSIRDEVDLLTGETKIRIGTTQLDGSEDDWVTIPAFSKTNVFRRPFSLAKNEIRDYETKVTNMLTDRLPIVKYNTYDEFNQQGITFSSLHNTNTYNDTAFYINLNSSNDVPAFKQWLKEHPVTVHFELKVPAQKQIKLVSNRVALQEIQMNGEILPSILSIHLPTTRLTFKLDPNQPEGQQFIAPTFSITNESQMPLTLTVKEFKQLTNQMRDVRPEEHSNWENLTREQSTDIALALVTAPSECWLTRREESHYVLDSAPSTLGIIKGKSSVELTFLAHHGRALSKHLAPQYRLILVFDFKK